MLPTEARNVVRQVRAGRAGALFPPVARTDRDGLVWVSRVLSGDRDARRLEAVLSAPRFRPFVAMLEELGAWRRDVVQRYAGVVSSRALSFARADWLGPLASDAFAVCATAPADASANVRRLSDGFRAFFDVFLARLARDLDGGALAREGFRGPVVSVWTSAEETHNGRQHVLRVRFRTGGTLAYKSRPASGEALFLARSAKPRGARGARKKAGASRSVFDMLNALPAASGAIHLPTMRILSGTGRDRHAYGWHEWIARPSQWGTIRSTKGRRLEGPRLKGAVADRFWHRAGSLSAACFAFGIVDLAAGNVVVGARAGEREALAYPIDLEVFFFPVRRLWETGLIAGARDEKNHHVAFEKLAWLCSTTGPRACFVEGAKGELHFARQPRAWGRTETCAAIADEVGNVGYAAHLAPYLRGMFDAWTLLCTKKDHVVRFLARTAKRHFVRVLPKPTHEYVAELERALFRFEGARGHDGEPQTANASPSTAYSAEERAQLERFDVPYFFRRADGGPLLWIREVPAARGAHAASGWAEAGAQDFTDTRVSPATSVLRGHELTYVSLGVAVRDAVETVFGDVGAGSWIDARRGVRIELVSALQGAVSFDWKEAGKRLTYTWDEDTVRLALAPIDAPYVSPLAPPAGAAGAMRRELLRIERADASLRSTWAAGDFTDAAIERELEQSTNAAVEWLRDAIRQNGWPSVRLVGADASDAACRLLQHAERHVAFQKECLRLIEDAARAGDAPLRHVAYLTDTVRAQSHEKQRFGTKFVKQDGELVPYPIDDEPHVDERRREMGLEPLSAYAARLRERFQPLTPAPVRATPARTPPTP